jgi:hypothetical protein
VTGKHLPPDTGREISTLKKRVSDLERMLDRVRRDTAAVTPTVYDTPFAMVTGGGRPLADGVLTPFDWPAINRAVIDPTRHIHTDLDTAAFTILIPGYYEFGGTVVFYEDGTEAGQRSLAIASSYGFSLEVLTVDRAPGDVTILSGSVIAWADQSSVMAWRLAASHDAGPVMVDPRSFWVRFVTTTEALFIPGEA